MSYAQKNARLLAAREKKVEQNTVLIAPIRTITKVYAALKIHRVVYIKSIEFSKLYARRRSSPFTL